MPLIAHQFEIVTSITIFLVGAILTVYLFLLKKNGWIGYNLDSAASIPNLEKPLQKTGENKNFLSTKGNEVVMSKPKPSTDILRGKGPLEET